MTLFNVLKNIYNDNYANLIIQTHNYETWNSLYEYGRYIANFYFNIPDDLQDFINYEQIAEYYWNENTYLIDDKVYEIYNFVEEFE